MELHFSGLNDIDHFSSHFSRFFRSSWRSSQSLSVFTFLYKTQSSANSRTWECLAALTRSFMNNKQYRSQHCSLGHSRVYMDPVWAFPIHSYSLLPVSQEQLNPRVSLSSHTIVPQLLHKPLVWYLAECFGEVQDNHLDLRLLLKPLMEFLCEWDELDLTTTSRTKALLLIRENGVLIEMVQNLGDNYVFN